MKLIKVKPTRKMDWANYITPEDQKIIKDERCFRICNRLDVIVDGKGRMDISLHTGDEYEGDIILSEATRKKLIYVLLHGAKNINR